MKTIYIITCSDELTTVFKKSDIKNAVEQYGLTLEDEDVLRSMYNTMNAGDAYTEFTSDDGIGVIRVYEQRV